ncbi:hypothetical protein L7F22_049804 [Adiantum nelumboides]|nr:hypothetical protein [Adiantum nelumboides]
MVQLAKIKSRKVKRKLQLGLLKPVDYMLVAAACAMVQPRAVPNMWSAKPVVVKPVRSVPMDSYVCKVPMPKKDEHVFKEHLCKIEKVVANCQVQQQQVKKGAAVSLPCDDDEVDQGSSLVEMDSDEVGQSEYDCSYEEGDPVGAMLQDEEEWEEFLSLLSEDVARHMLEEQIEEPLVKEQAGLDVFEEEKQTMNAIELLRKICASLLIGMLVDAAVHWAIGKEQESVVESSTFFGWEGGSRMSNMYDEQVDERSGTLFEASYKGMHGIVEGCKACQVRLQIGTPKDIGKQPFYSDLRKRKHEWLSPTEKELKGFSQSLEQMLDQEGDLRWWLALSQVLIRSMFDKQNVSISYLDICIEEKEIVSSMLSGIEGRVKKDDRVCVRDGVWVAAFVSTSIMFLPPNFPVHGIPSSTTQEWNNMDVSHFGKVAHLSYPTAYDNGMFITVCIPSQHRMVLDVAGATGWEPAFTIVTVCTTPVFKDANMTIRSLLLTVLKKNQTTIAEAVVKPNEDTWLDTIQEGEWTMQDAGTPLRGGMEHGHCYLCQILNVYTKKRDVVVQYGGDIGVLALLGSQMDRYFTIMEHNEAYLGKFWKIVEAQAARLSKRKALDP